MASSSKQIPLDPNFAVNFFWDFDNTPVPPHLMPNLIVNITSSLQTLDSRYHLAKNKYAVGNVSLPFISQHIRFLEKNSFMVVDAPKPASNLIQPYQRTEGVAKRIIVQKMLQLVLTEHAKNILLISSDSDFGITLSMLKGNGYKVFLARLTNESRSGYEGDANYVWDWSKMQKETTCCCQW